MSVARGEQGGLLLGSAGLAATLAAELWRLSVEWLKRRLLVRASLDSRDDAYRCIPPSTALTPHPAPNPLCMQATTSSSPMDTQKSSLVDNSCLACPSYGYD